MATKGRVAPNKGRRMSAAQRRKISESMKRLHAQRKETKEAHFRRGTLKPVERIKDALLDLPLDIRYNDIKIEALHGLSRELPQTGKLKLVKKIMEDLELKEY